VLLHGLTGSWRIWRPVLASLSAEHDVFAPTIAGHHGGPAIRGAPRIEALADAVEGSMDAAGIQTAHVAGNSLGGWLALELARRGRARSVIAMSPAGAWRSSRDLQRVTTMFIAAAKITPYLLPHLGWAIRRPYSRRLLLLQAMQRGDLIPLNEALELFDDFAQCTIIEELVGEIRDSGGFAGELPSTAPPIRIAWGARDRTIPFDQYGSAMVALVPNAQLRIMPGVGHVPMYDDPALVARTILEVTQATDAADQHAGARRPTKGENRR
jgi:pimeloyl-ACP methyl ester carboxylesterase